MNNITWYTGNTGSGKTTAAKKQRGILLDGNEMRDVWPGLDLSEESRREQCLRTARLAKLLASQGFAVNVAVIAPYRDLRDAIHNITGCRFIYLWGGHEPDETHPYEYPDGARHKPGWFIDQVKAAKSA